jgi:hypothetical protein
MSQETSHPRTVRMWMLLAPATLYLAWILFFPDVTVSLLFDGSVGVLLGLYICSQPAANGIDLIFQQRGTFRRVMKHSSGVEWLMLNALVMIVGWFVMVLGAARFMTPAYQPAL